MAQYIEKVRKPSLTTVYVKNVTLVLHHSSPNRHDDIGKLFMQLAEERQIFGHQGRGIRPVFSA